MLAHARAPVAGHTSDGSYLATKHLQTNRRVRGSPRPVAQRETGAYMQCARAFRGGFFNAQAIASSGVAGILTVGAVLAQLPDMEACIVRSERKDYGRCRIVEGARPESVVFIDDILSGANSALRAIRLLEEEGVHVEGVLTIVCYGWGRGAGRLASANVKATHLVNLSRRFKPSQDIPEDVFEQINRNPARIPWSISSRPQ